MDEDLVFRIGPNESDRDALARFKAFLAERAGRAPKPGRAGVAKPSLRAFDEKTDAKIAARYRDDLASLPSLVEEFGGCANSIRRAIERQGVAIRDRGDAMKAHWGKRRGAIDAAALAKMEAEADAKIAAFYAAGNSMADCQLKFRCRNRRVAAALERTNTPTRPPGRPSPRTQKARAVVDPKSGAPANPKTKMAARRATDATRPSRESAPPKSLVRSGGSIEPDQIEPTRSAPRKSKTTEIPWDAPYRVVPIGEAIAAQALPATDTVGGRGKAGAKRVAQMREASRTITTQKRRAEAGQPIAGDALQGAVDAYLRAGGQVTVIAGPKIDQAKSASVGLAYGLQGRARSGGKG